jgi:hypothetical protein
MAADLVHSKGLLWLKLCFAAVHVFTLNFILNRSHFVRPNTDQAWLYMKWKLTHSTVNMLHSLHRM